MILRGPKSIHGPTEDISFVRLIVLMDSYWVNGVERCCHRSRKDILLRQAVDYPSSRWDGYGYGCVPAPGVSGLSVWLAFIRINYTSTWEESRKSQKLEWATCPCPRARARRQTLHWLDDLRVVADNSVDVCAANVAVTATYWMKYEGRRLLETVCNQQFSPVVYGSGGVVHTAGCSTPEGLGVALLGRRGSVWRWFPRSASCEEDNTPL